MDVSDPLTVDTVLAPVDGSEDSATAVEYAVAIADRYDATVHVLFVLGREVVHGMDSGVVSETDVAENTQGFLEEVAGVTDAYDVSFSMSTAHGFSSSVKTRHPGSVVLDAAESVDADFIVLPRESVTDAPTEVLEKAAEYVLSYASQPVLSV
ncbi:universal stress protein [Natronosalvus rutilus]|uniref:Universal stress protein n=1 Tax=Natronosalvus rutilus TaxID=2953753 RepID=A0A9E7N965_9EURY|nr:universal stress protein [Natronosalvus rutilus]UTF54032.1 universal stress protein [Natronosalvus rutilus]